MNHDATNGTVGQLEPAGLRLPSDVWVHPSVEVRVSSVAGCGLFATARIVTGEVVIRLGGRLVNTDELHGLFANAADDEYIDTFAIGDDAHVVLPPNTTAHFGNHACDPTIWPINAYELAVRRVIQPDEELTIDYALISNDPTFTMKCRCGTGDCRQVITGNDWQQPELQRGYAGHWTPALHHKMKPPEISTDEPA